MHITGGKIPAPGCGASTSQKPPPAALPAPMAKPPGSPTCGPNALEQPQAMGRREGDLPGDQSRTSDRVFS